VIKTALLILVLLVVVIPAAGLLYLRSLGGVTEVHPAATSSSLYDLRTHTREGEPSDLGAYLGQVALVVNLASKCGLFHSTRD
jgi:hypothetical protein